jgi:hypothetical protein
MRPALDRLRRLAVLSLLLAAAAASLPNAAAAQSVAVRAQGHFYSAREAYLAKRHGDALRYVYQSKKALGGTNLQLQHLHVLAAYHAGRYAEAQREMATFFELTEKEVPEVRFSRSVQPLTNDEVTELTKLINRIDEGVLAEQEADRAAAARRAAAAAEKREMARWAGRWIGDWGDQTMLPSQYWLTLEHTGERSFTGTFTWERLIRGYGTVRVQQTLRGAVTPDGRQLVMQASPMRVLDGEPNFHYGSGSYEFHLHARSQGEGLRGRIQWPDRNYQGTIRQSVELRRIR